MSHTHAVEKTVSFKNQHHISKFCLSPVIFLCNLFLFLALLWLRWVDLLTVLTYLHTCTKSPTPTPGGVRDPSCHQLDAEHPICSEREPPWWRAGGHLSVRHDPGLGASRAHAHSWRELLPLVGHSVRQHQSGSPCSCCHFLTRLNAVGTTVCWTCSCVLFNQVMSNPDRRPCHNKDFLRYNNIINGADWHNVPGSKNVCVF